jgi:integrase
MTPRPGDTPGPPLPAGAAPGAATGVLDGVFEPETEGPGVSGSPADGAAEATGALAAVVEDELAGLWGAAAGLVDAAKAANTRAAYGSDWARFAGWCADRELAALPAAPATLGAYLTAAATDPAAHPPGYTPATLARWVAAVNFAHRRAGHPAPGAHPHVGELLAGIRREHGRPPARRDALVTADLRVILAALPVTGWPAVVAARRDAALLVLGFAGAFRRGELAALDVGDVRAHRTDGLHVTVRAAKNDPGREGQVKALPYGVEVATCGPCAWARWRAVVTAAGAGGRAAVMRTVLTDDPAGHVCRSPAAEAEGDSGEPAFRALHKTGRIRPGRLTGPAVTAIVQRRAAAAGYDPTRLGGHSLRAGFVTAAVLAGADAHAIMRQTGHRTPVMIEVYTRHHAPLEANAVTRLGL